MSKQILITGGAGFVGSHLADGLLRAGHRVRVLDDLTPQVHAQGMPEYLSREIECIVGDVRDPNRLKEVLAGVDVVFHFAATVGVGQSMYEISRYMSMNTQGTAELLQAILDSRAPLEKLIVASSMSIYGEGRYACSDCGRASAPPVRSTAQLRAGKWELECAECGGILKPRPTEETKPSEINSVYALSKRDQEEICLIFGRTYGLPVTALRFFNIYGTRQALSNPYTGVAAIFASRLLNGEPPFVFEDGEQMRDFVSVHDIVEANIAAMTCHASDGEVINVGCGIRAAIPTFHGVNERQPLDFHSPYGCSKGAADQYVRDYGRIYDLPTVVFRMSCIAGPRQFGNEDQGWVAHFLYSVLAGKQITIYGNGCQVRDVLHVYDLVNAMRAVRSTNPRANGEVYNLGGGFERSISVLELLREIERRTNTPLRLNYRDVRPGDQPLYIADTSKLEQQTGWRARNSLGDTLDHIYQFWLENRGKITRERTAPPAIAEMIREVA